MSGLGQFRASSGGSRTFLAAYDGECGRCGGEISEGDEVCYQDDVLIHDECRDED